MASFAPASDSDYIPTSSKLPLHELIPYCACICFVTSCYTEFPDCIGCAGKRICLCCYSEFMSCKFSKETEEDIWCHINKGHTYCGSVETCCMQRAQLFCLDVRCSLPLMEEIPVLVTCCFFTFYYKEECGPFEFFKTVKELDDITATSAVTAGPPHGHHLKQPQEPPLGQAQGSSNATTTNIPPSTITAQTQTNNINTGSSETHTTSSPLTSTVQNS